MRRYIFLQTGLHKIYDVLTMTVDYWIPVAVLFHPTFISNDTCIQKLLWFPMNYRFNLFCMEILINECILPPFIYQIVQINYWETSCLKIFHFRWNMVWIYCFRLRKVGCNLLFNIYPSYSCFFALIYNLKYNLISCIRIISSDFIDIWSRIEFE